MRVRHFFFLFLFLTACKKDLLHWGKVQRINTGTSSSLYNIRFINDSICLIGGGVIWSQAEVLRSQDGGFTWTSSSYPAAGVGMMGFCVSPGGDIYMCGANGNVLRSADEGKTWQPHGVGNQLFYVAVSFPAADTGVLLYTHLQEDGAIVEVDSDLNVLSEKTYNFGLNNIYMLSATTGYVLGYGAVMKTTDSRHTWNFQNVKGDNFMAMDIHGDEIWMCGYNGSVYHTVNGGNNWQRLRNGNDISLPRYSMLDIKFKDEQNGWAVCDNGKIIHSDDGGKHWEEYDQFTTNALRSIAICPNGDLMVGGDNGGLYRITTDQ